MPRYTELFKRAIVVALVVTSFAFSGNLTRTFSFTDDENITNDLYELLDAGHYILIHTSYDGCPFCPQSFEDLNKLYYEYGENENTLLVYEVNVSSNKDETFYDWAENNGGGVDYSVVLHKNGGQMFDYAVGNNGTGNPKYLLYPDRTYKDVSNDYREQILEAKTSFGDLQGSPFLVVFSPDGGEYFNLGEEVTIEWYTRGCEDVDISLLKDGVFLNDIGIASATTNGEYGAFKWTIPTSLDPNGNYTIVVASKSGSLADTSNGSFKVLPYGKVDQSTITIEEYSSFMTYDGVEYKPELSLDGNMRTFWSNELKIPGFVGTLPAYVTYKLDKEYPIVGFSYLPRDQESKVDVDGYTFEVSSDGESWTNAKTGNFPQNAELQVVEFDPIDSVRYVRFTATTAHVEWTSASIAEFNLFYGIEEEEEEETGIATNTQTGNLGNTISMTTTNSSIQISLQDREMATVQILTVSGRVISSYSLSEYGVGTTSLELPTNLSNGLYLVQFVGESVSSVQSLTILK